MRKRTDRSVYGAKSFDDMKSRTVFTTSCWIWLPGKIAPDYGHVWAGGKRRLAHRVAYEFLVGPIPEGLVIDHLCGIKRCINPAHLEPVTFLENLLRSSKTTSGRHRCKFGHLFTEENTYRNPTSGIRQCRICIKRRTKEGHERTKAKKAALKTAPLAEATFRGQMSDELGAIERVIDSGEYEMVANEP